MVLVNNPGDWGHLYAPLAHAEWNGWTFTDLVFPFFLFAAGLSMAISIDRRVGSGMDRATLVRSLALRAAIIFGVGLALNFIPGFDLSTLRVPGVLQRIALCVLVAAPMAVHSSTRSVGAWIAILLAAYAIPMLLVPVPGPDGIVAAGRLEPGRDFGSWVDRAILDGHLWSKSRTWDPEGLVSTLPAIASLLFGVITGRALLAARGGMMTTLMMAAAGLAALAIGLALDALFMPINKNLWTPSYCVFMAGWSLVAFAAFHAMMDTAPSAAFRAGARRALLPLVIFGMNALFIFAFSGLVARLLGSRKAWLYAPLQALPIAPENASLLFAIAFELAMFAVAWTMWKKGWFVKV